MKHIILFVLLIHSLHASSMNLKKVLASAQNKTALTHSKENKRYLLEAQNLAQTSRDPLELYASGARAHPMDAKSEYEYSIGLSQQLSLGDTQAQEEMMNRLNNEAKLLDEDKKILNFKNSLKNLYHQHCLDYRNYRTLHQSYQDLSKLYTKKQKAYIYEEISKAELMQIKLEKERLHAQLQEMQMTYKISKEKLFIVGGIHHTKNTQLSCTDMYPVRENIKVKNNLFELTKEAYEKRVKSTKVALKRHSKALDSMNISVQYDREIGMERYGVGVSIPLNFSSKKAEQERAADLYQGSALGYEYEQTMLTKKALYYELRAMIKNHAMMIRSLKENVHNYKKNLLPLMKKSYTLGESSVIEYLLSRQKYYQYTQELINTQKAYYQALFSLYTLTETKDN